MGRLNGTGWTIERGKSYCRTNRSEFLNPVDRENVARVGRQAGRRGPALERTSDANRLTGVEKSPPFVIRSTTVET